MLRNRETVIARFHRRSSRELDPGHFPLISRCGFQSAPLQMPNWLKSKLAYKARAVTLSLMGSPRLYSSERNGTHLCDEIQAIRREGEFQRDVCLSGAVPLLPDAVALDVGANIGPIGPTMAFVFSKGIRPRWSKDRLIGPLNQSADEATTPRPAEV